MTTAEKVELGSIPVLGIGFWLMAPLFPDRIGVGRLLLVASALLLFQSLIRDLWLLSQAKRSSTTKPVTTGRCMCIESLVGAVGIVIGALWLGFAVTPTITMENWGWSILILMVMGIGFSIKDYVFEWSPWQLRRDKDHINIVFTWKK